MNEVMSAWHADEIPSEFNIINTLYRDTRCEVVHCIVAIFREEATGQKVKPHHAKH